MTKKRKVHSLTGRITPRLMSQAFEAVKRNRGAAGIDKVSVEMFDANRHENLTALMRDTVPEAARRLTRAEIETRLTAEDVPCGAVRSLGELHEDPQVVANGTLVEGEHPRCGRLRQPRPPVRFGGEPGTPGGPAPGLGEHTDAILAELGLAGETAALRADGIVA